MKWGVNYLLKCAAPMPLPCPCYWVVLNWEDDNDNEEDDDDHNEADNECCNCVTITITNTPQQLLAQHNSLWFSYHQRMLTMFILVILQAEHSSQQTLVMYLQLLCKETNTSTSCFRSSRKIALLLYSNIYFDLIKQFWVIVGEEQRWCLLWSVQAGIMSKDQWMLQQLLC